VAHQDLFSSGTSDPENFLTLGQIEQLMLEHQRHIHEIDLKVLLENMRSLSGESAVIARKKKEYRLKGIKLRNFRRCTTSILTRVGRVSYDRMVLIPSSSSDAERLKGLGIEGYVHPLDEALGLSRLPFKITPAAMLDIAMEATRCESYEDAEQILRERSNIKINDDTMRKVTNTIGSMVFKNEVDAAEQIWFKLNSGDLIFPDEKLNHTLYLEVDGAMFPLRQEDNKGTFYKENKLGMAFSTDNIHWWRNLHKVLQHRILKREYTSFIGDVEMFTKLIFSLAINNKYGEYKNTVLLSDGATWIRNMKNFIFPDAQQILDFYHLKEHISDYYKQVYKNDNAQSQSMTDQVSNYFKDSDYKMAISLLKKTAKGNNKTYFEKLYNYIENNKENIDYVNYRAKGFFIGSGAIESSNKLIQRRVKFTGMRWKLESAQAVVSLVAKARSGLWESKVAQAVYSHFGEPDPSLFSRFQ
jgi:hypothetical protein